MALYGNFSLSTYFDYYFFKLYVKKYVLEYISHQLIQFMCVGGRAGGATLYNKGGENSLNLMGPKLETIYILANNVSQINIERTLNKCCKEHLTNRPVKICMRCTFKL